MAGSAIRMTEYSEIATGTWYEWNKITLACNKPAKEAAYTTAFVAWPEKSVGTRIVFIGVVFMYRFVAVFIYLNLRITSPVWDDFYQ
jgi:hypothetical protein